MAVLKKHRPPISSFEQGEITEPFLGASFLEPAFIAARFSFLWVKRQTLCFTTKGGFRPHGPRIQVLFDGDAATPCVASRHLISSVIGVPLVQFAVLPIFQEFLVSKFSGYWGRLLDCLWSWCSRRHPRRLILSCSVLDWCFWFPP